jgi:hypothetical protein
MRVCNSNSKIHSVVKVSCISTIVVITFWVISDRILPTLVGNKISNSINEDSVWNVPRQKTLKQKHQYATGKPIAHPVSKFTADSSQSSSSRLKASSYDALNHSDAQKLQSMLTNDEYSKVMNTSCQLKDTRLYPYQKYIKATALVSFPRSGNTWVRTLIEKSTGYRTSSIYCDRGLASLQSECSRSNVFLIKTHRSMNTINRTKRRKPYDQFVYLVRNPFDAFLSMYKFQSGSGRTVRSKHETRPSHNGTTRLLSIENIKRYIAHYRGMFGSCLKSSLPRIIIRYEDMKVSPAIVLRLIRRFLLPFQKNIPDSSETNKRPYLIYYFDDVSQFNSKNDRMVRYLREENEKLACAIQEDLAGTDLVYRSNKYGTLHSLNYYQKSTIKYITTELLEALCYLKYDVLFKNQLNLTCNN